MILALFAVRLQDSHIKGENGFDHQKRNESDQVL